MRFSLLVFLISASLLIIILFLMPFNTDILSGETLFDSITPPSSLTSVGETKIFGTSDMPGPDGTVFDYINGGGIVYIKHGMREVTHKVYADSSGNTVTVDLFDMRCPDNAEAAFNDPEICPEGFEECGDECKAYHYVPDYFLYLRQGAYLVYAATGNDSLRPEVLTLAEDIETMLMKTSPFE